MLFSKLKFFVARTRPVSKILAIIFPGAYSDFPKYIAALAFGCALLFVKIFTHTSTPQAFFSGSVFTSSCFSFFHEESLVLPLGTAKVRWRFNNHVACVKEYPQSRLLAPALSIWGQVIHLNNPIALSANHAFSEYADVISSLNPSSFFYHEPERQS